MRLISGSYKTYEGARKRAAFENALARHEYERGYKARVYHYTVVAVAGKWRAQRKDAQVQPC